MSYRNARWLHSDASDDADHRVSANLEFVVHPDEVNRALLGAVSHYRTEMGRDLRIGVENREDAHFAADAQHLVDAAHVEVEIQVIRVQEEQVRAE